MTIVGSRSETRSRTPGMSRRIPARAARHYLAVFGQQAAQAVDLGGAELHQLLAHAMQRQDRLLLFALDRNRLDPGLLHRRPDRPRVLHVVFVAADERSHQLHRQQTDLVAQLPHASMLTRHAARLAKCSSSFARVSRWSTISPVSRSTQCNWNTHFAVSTPTTVLLACMRWIPVYPGSFFVRDVRAPHAGQSSGPDHRAYDPAARARRPDLSPIVDTPRNTPLFQRPPNPRTPRFEGHLMDSKVLIHNFVGRSPCKPHQHAVAHLRSLGGDAGERIPLYPGSFFLFAGGSRRIVAVSSPYEGRWVIRRE